MIYDRGEGEIKLIAVMLGQFRTHLQVRTFICSKKRAANCFKPPEIILGRKLISFRSVSGLRDSHPLSVAFLK